jgi:hypothetical protein
METLDGLQQRCGLLEARLEELGAAGKGVLTHVEAARQILLRGGDPDEA